jgi:UDP-N-acetylglucosamine--N-acetylmuramyl-(pentapeptide) pyrophosphoryl-undecaprenol N-acetylglucosamine transferase
LHQAYQEAGVEAEVTGFIDDMAGAYGEADLVICRAGAMTVSEVAAAGVASLMIPFPHAVDDHQTGNARFLADRGAALLLPQSECTPETLADRLSAMTRARLQSMAEAARRLARPDAALEVAQACEALVVRSAASSPGTVS